MAVALLVQKSTTDPEIEGSNTTRAQLQEKIADKKSLVNWMASSGRTLYKAIKY